MSTGDSNIRWSIDNDHNSRLVIRIDRWLDSGADVQEIVTLRLGPGDALDFMAKVAQHTSFSVRDAGVALARGDCDTCGNTRLIDQPKNGRSWMVSCPDCHPGDHREFPPVPQIGGGVA